MTKKFIAILTIATILFVCVFASCEKEKANSPYADADDIEAITNENGEFELAEDGQYLVYVTDEDGKKVTDENGEYETDVQQFIPNIKKDVIEDYGFKLKIPKGWKVAEGDSVFTRGSDEQLKVNLVKQTYDKYYGNADKFFGGLFEEGIKGSIEEDVSLIEGADRAFKVVFYNDGITYVTVAFENHGNLYSLAYQAPSDIADLDAVNEFIPNWEFKPFTYYPELTAVSEESESGSTTAEATTK